MESNQKIIEKFKKDFQKVKDAKWIKSMREHDTGIGKTFEELMNVVENNNADVDYLGLLEFKSTRGLSSSLITIFTQKPSNPPNANRYIKETYGVFDEEFPSIKTIHTTISSDFNTFKSQFGFKLRVDYNEQKIFIEVKDLESNEIHKTNFYYTFECLKHIIEKKCQYIVYTIAENKKIENQEYFKFSKALLLTGLNFEKFLQEIENKNIVYDIRIGIYRSGKKKGQPHDHGSGFRFKKDKLNQIFSTEEL